MRQPVVPEGEVSDRAEADRIIEPSPRGMTPSERLGVYREQFWFRHWASLAEDFPTVLWLLGGRARFDALASEYLDASPPSVWNLQVLGAGLPGHVATKAPWSNDPALADAAQLDWAYVHAFDAPDASPFDVAKLAAIPEEALAGAILGFHPSLQMLALKHAVTTTRREILLQRTPTRPVPGVTHAAVWRDASHRLCDVAVEPDAFELWTDLSRRRALGRACEDLAGRLPADRAADLDARVGQWFQEWTARGWVAQMAFPP